MYPRKKILSSSSLRFDEYFIIISLRQKEAEPKIVQTKGRTSNIEKGIIFVTMSNEIQ